MAIMNLLPLAAATALGASLFLSSAHAGDGIQLPSQDVIQTIVMLAYALIKMFKKPKQE